MGYANLVIYQPDPDLVWKPIPNQNCYTKFGHKPIHINDEGTRGKHFSKYKEKKHSEFYHLATPELLAGDYQNLKPIQDY